MFKFINDLKFKIKSHKTAPCKSAKKILSFVKQNQEDLINEQILSIKK